MSRKLTYPAVLTDMMQFVMSTEPPLMKKPPPCESRKVLAFSQCMKSSFNRGGC